MARKLRFYYIWNIKHILVGVIVILISLIAIVGFYSYPRWYNFYKLSRYDKVAWGKVLSFHEKSIIRQTQYGSGLKVDHFKVKYTFSYSDSTYIINEEVNGTFLNGYRLRNVLSKQDSIAKIRFLSSDPSDSMVDLTEIKE
ncbi:hypothetical protein JMN32_11580 [Fulvivirga sp. 29W222]|uniref:FHA domain-containing protein n=1 Tax=Fulvivirga marina TaxID=2494733 RepID=A0A937FVT1_9BACT|nr:hypothetical protein [Fulvivirga marina]MBL6446954.1 hypothetical protein [Fulvivirga marina]